MGDYLSDEVSPLAATIKPVRKNGASYLFPELS
jgi:hypothetical protein